MSEWIGTSISLYLRSSDDVYQGRIEKAATNYITISHVFRNGLPLPDCELTFQSTNISNIEIIEEKNEPKTIILSKPKPRKYIPQAPSSPIPFQIKTSTPNKQLNTFANHKDRQCFQDSVLDEASIPNFDFEKNLALFDKKQFDNTTQKGRLSSFTRNSYKCHENVLEPIRISPYGVELLHDEGDVIKYVTSNGFVIPSLKPVMLEKIRDVLNEIGFSMERQNELFARCIVDMVLQMIGGDRRLQPHNQHQAPTVAVLCSNQNQGIVGIICARQLSGLGVNTVVYTNCSPHHNLISTEIHLYSMTNHPIHTNLLNMPSNIDFIIAALGDEDTEFEADWVQKRKTAVLAIDPPPAGMRLMTAKFSVIPILPLANSEKNGRLYLCNLSIPIKVFDEVGIKYRSPFGSKSSVALYRTEE